MANLVRLCRAHNDEPLPTLQTAQLHLDKSRNQFIPPESLLSVWCYPNVILMEQGDKLLQIQAQWSHWAWPGHAAQVRQRWAARYELYQHRVTRWRPSQGPHGFLFSQVSKSSFRLPWLPSSFCFNLRILKMIQKIPILESFWYLITNEAVWEKTSSKYWSGNIHMINTELREVLKIHW